MQPESKSTDCIEPWTLPVGIYESYYDNNSEAFFLDIGYRPDLAKTLAHNVNHLTLRHGSAAANHYILEVTVLNTDIPPWQTPIHLDAKGHSRTVHQLGGGINGAASLNTITNTFQWDDDQQDLYRVCEKSDGVIYYVHYTFCNGGSVLVNTRQGPTKSAEVRFKRIQ